jgi:hypothetical protein
MTTEDYLLQRFGPLMSLNNLANILGRSSESIRIGLYSESKLSDKLRPTVVRVGRRIYFRTMQLSTALELDNTERGSDHE